MNTNRSSISQKQGRSNKGFLFLILLAMFMIVFVLPKMKGKNPAESPTGPDGGGILIPDQSQAPGRPMPTPKGAGGVDWQIEEVQIGGTEPAKGSNPFEIPGSANQGGTITLPGTIPLPNGRTPGFNPNPGTVDVPPTKTTSGDWSIEVDDAKPSGTGIRPIERTKPGKTSTKGDWQIETK